MVASRHVHTAERPAEDDKDWTIAPRAKSDLWDLSVTVPKWAPKALGASRAVPAATAVGLELEMAKAMRRLRRRMRELWEGSGMKGELRPLTLERWRWSAKWEEEQAAATLGKKKPAAMHPVLPSQAAPAADEELALELERQGLSAERARAVVGDLRSASATHAAALLKLSHQAASGMPLTTPPIELHAHKHTVDLVCGRAQVKLTWPAYGKLTVLHRRHAPTDEATAPPTAAALASADGIVEWAEHAGAVAGAATKAAAATAGSGEDERATLHARLMAMLLRYKALGGHGYQAAIGAPVWKVLRTKLDVGVEGFASPLNAHLPAYGSAFGDLDGVFGSRGSFFSLRPLSGSYEANVCHTRRPNPCRPNPCHPNPWPSTCRPARSALEPAPRTARLQYTDGLTRMPLEPCSCSRGSRPLPRRSWTLALAMCCRCWRARRRRRAASPPSHSASSCQAGRSLPRSRFSRRRGGSGCAC